MAAKKTTKTAKKSPKTTTPKKTEPVKKESVIQAQAPQEPKKKFGVGKIILSVLGVILLIFIAMVLINAFAPKPTAQVQGDYQGPPRPRIQVRHQGADALRAGAGCRVSDIGNGAGPQGRIAVAQGR